MVCPHSTRSWPTSSPPRKRSDRYEEAYSSRPLYPIHDYAQLAVLDALFAEIDAALVQLDANEYCALRKYYLDGLKWEQVAADMNFTSRGIFALRRRAIEHLKL